MNSIIIIDIKITYNICFCDIYFIEFPYYLGRILILMLYNGVPSVRFGSVRSEGTPLYKN
jgi:hypothetical protein